MGLAVLAYSEFVPRSLPMTYDYAELTQMFKEAVGKLEPNRRNQLVDVFYREFSDRQSSPSPSLSLLAPLSSARPFPFPSSPSLQTSCSRPSLLLDVSPVEAIELCV